MINNKLIALILLLMFSIIVTFTVASTNDHNVWHFFEIIALIAALLFYFWGAAAAVSLATLVGVVYLPGAGNYLNYIRLSIMALVVAWFALREKDARERVSRLLMVDRLTGLHNYSYFIDRLEEERQRADRFGSRLSLIMIDIDWFKPFNDEYGHRLGNDFLIKLARIFLKEVRVVDIVCRYGGEEFAIILPNTSKAAAEVAERIREAVAKTEFPVSKEDKMERRTVSAGVATYPDDAEDELQLIDRADEALYLAKQSGRNRVVVYGDEIKKGRLTVV